jgi:hypothetical protein
MRHAGRREHQSVPHREEGAGSQGGSTGGSWESRELGTESIGGSRESREHEHRRQPRMGPRAPEAHRTESTGGSQARRGSHRRAWRGTPRETKIRIQEPPHGEDARATSERALGLGLPRRLLSGLNNADTVREGLRACSCGLYLGHWEAAQVFVEPLGLGSAVNGPV